MSYEPIQTANQNTNGPEDDNGLPPEAVIRNRVRVSQFGYPTSTFSLAELGQVMKTSVDPARVAVLAEAVDFLLKGKRSR